MSEVTRVPAAGPNTHSPREQQGVAPAKAPDIVLEVSFEHGDNESEQVDDINLSRQGSLQPGISGSSCVLMPPPQRQDSVTSIKSIMEGVRERMGMLEGTIADGTPLRGLLFTGHDWGSSNRNSRFAHGSGPLFEVDVYDWPSAGSRSNRHLVRGGAESPWHHSTTNSAAQDAPSAGGARELQPKSSCSIPFRVAMICPTLIMLVACVCVFVPLAMFALETQRSTFIAYRHSVAVQRQLITDTVLNATQWVLLEATKSVEQAVFVGIVEPPDRAVDTLTGAIRLLRSRPGWDFSHDPLRRNLAYRAWEELSNQWTCTQLNNNLCSGRAQSLYAAMAGGQVMGAAFRPRFFGSTLAKQAQFVLDAPALDVDSNLTKLKVYEASELHIRRGALYMSRTYDPTRRPYFIAQEMLAKRATGTAEGAEVGLKKTWSQLYLLDPWWAGENDSSAGGQLALSWTSPLSTCANYSCMDGVVAADTTLDLVSYELHLAWSRLQQELNEKPWSFDLQGESSSIFIVNQISPLFPEQCGLLVGASHFTEAMPVGKLLHAVDSPSALVAATARAVLLRFLSWNATELTVPGNDQSFHFSLKAAQQGKIQECHPLSASPEATWEFDCFRVTTHTIFLDDSLQWLVVAVIPATAFSKFYLEAAIEVDMEVQKEQTDAEKRVLDALVQSSILGMLAAFVVLLLGLVTSCFVLRPLAYLTTLMRRLGQLDFAHDSIEYRKLHRSRRGRVQEVNELQEGFCRLSKSIEVFARFVPDSVVRRLMSGDPRASRLNVSRRVVTIMFSDVRDFTSIAEELKQDDLVFVLTLYLSVMTRVIESYEGVVGEILGDGILAFWNTPDDVEDHAAMACAAALAQQKALGPMNAELAKLGLPEISIRIGINTGEVLTGNIGSETKMKFGCMGDPVNLASRLEGLCKVYGVGIICSAATMAKLPAKQGFVCRKLDLVQVKGKKESTTIYEVMGRDLLDFYQEDLPSLAQGSFTTSTDRPVLLDPGGPITHSVMGQAVMGGGTLGTYFEAVSFWEPVPASKVAQARLYEQAFEAWSQKDFAEAVHLSRQLLEEAPQDVAAQLLLQRSMDLLEIGEEVPAQRPMRSESLHGLHRTSAGYLAMKL